MQTTLERIIFKDQGKDETPGITLCPCAFIPKDCLAENPPPLKISPIFIRNARLRSPVCQKPAASFCSKLLNKSFLQLSSLLPEGTVGFKSRKKIGKGSVIFQKSCFRQVANLFQLHGQYFKFKRQVTSMQKEIFAHGLFIGFKTTINRSSKKAP